MGCAVASRAGDLSETFSYTRCDMAGQTCMKCRMELAEHWLLKSQVMVPVVVEHAVQAGWDWMGLCMIRGLQVCHTIVGLISNHLLSLTTPFQERGSSAAWRRVVMYATGI